MSWPVSGSVYAAAYAFMMSTLLLTLLLVAQSHPVEIGNVSLLPVVYVLESFVRNPPPAVVLKSLLKVAAVKCDGRGDCFAPAAVKMLSQSRVCVAEPMVVG